MAVESNTVQIVIDVKDANSSAVVGDVTQNVQKIGAAGDFVQTRMTGAAKSFQYLTASSVIAGRTVKQSLSEAGTVVAGVSQNLRQLGATASGVQAQVTSTAQSFQFLGSSGTIAGRVAKQGLDVAGEGMHGFKEHTLTALDNVRLFRDTMGIRLPRSMEIAITSSRLLMGAIQSIGTVMIAIGAIDIGVRLAQGLYNAYEKWISLSAAAKDYQDQVAKTKEEDFINVRDIETARMRIDEATASAKGFIDTAQQMHKNVWSDMVAGMRVGGLSGVVTAAMQDIYGGRQMADQGYKVKGQVDALTGPNAAFRHQQLLDEIGLQHASDARLRGEQKRTAELKQQLEVNAENRRYEMQQQQLKGNKRPDDAGQQHEEYLNQIAEQKAAADTFNLRREQAIALQNLRESALEAGLRGEALFHAQEAAAIEDLKNKDQDSIAARNAIHLKFHNEEMKRMQDQENEIRKMRGQTAVSGLTGVDRTRQEGRNRIDDLLNDQNSQMNPGQRLAAVHEITQQTQRAIVQEQQTFAEHVSDLVTQSANRTVEGFARIHADAEQAIAQLNRQASEQGGSRADLNRGTASIRKSEADQIAEQQRKNADETTQLESEARAKYLSAEKQQTAAIEEEYSERLRRFQEQLSRQEISEQDYNRRVVASGQLRDAEMTESARQAREKMAGEFTRFFANPMQAMKMFGERAAGEAAAALMQRMQGQVAGGTTGEHLGMPGGIFGKIAGIARPKDRATEGRSQSSPTGMVAINAAQIRIETASIVMSGSMGAARTLTPGSTSLLGGASLSPALFTSMRATPALLRLPATRECRHFQHPAAHYQARPVRGLTQRWAASTRASGFSARQRAFSDQKPAAAVIWPRLRISTFLDPSIRRETLISANQEPPHSTAVALGRLRAVRVGLWASSAPTRALEALAAQQAARWAACNSVRGSAARSALLWARRPARLWEPSALAAARKREFTT